MYRVRDVIISVCWSSLRSRLFQGLQQRHELYFVFRYLSYCALCQSPLAASAAGAALAGAAVDGLPVPTPWSAKSQSIRGWHGYLGVEAS